MARMQNLQIFGHQLFGGNCAASGLAAGRYLSEIGNENLSFMGYDKEDLLAALDADGEKHWSDILYLTGSPLYHRIELYALKTKRGRNGKAGFARR